LSLSVNVRCAPEWRARWLEAAEEEHRTLSNAIAVAMNRWADEVLERKRRRLLAAERQRAHEEAGGPPGATS
jgi:uncharacterized protein (DUF1778 family)